MRAGRRFTLRTKLLVSFAGVVLLVLTLLAAGERLVRDAARRMETTLTAQVRPLARLNRLQSQISRIRVLEVELPRLSDLFAVSDQVEMLNAEALAFDGELRAYLAEPGAFEPAQAQMLADQWQRYRADLQRIERHGHAMQLAAAGQIATFESVQRFKAIEHTLKLGAESTERRAQEAYAQAVAEHSQQRARFVMTSVVGLMLLAVWLALLARSMTGRLSRLRDAAAQLAAGAQKAPMAVPGNDELADLGRAFNTMQGTVVAREDALRAAHDELESRVARRTEELGAANTLLLREIEERRRAEELLQYQAQYDSLTRLPNRMLAMDRLQHALRVAQRGHHLVVLIFVDLDDFKKVNDTLGHPVGDELLVQAAARLSQAVRAEDTVARLGGDEFVVILGGLEDVEDAQAVADKVLHTFSPPFELGGSLLVVTPSMGLAVYPDDGEDASMLLRNADLAMYDAKEAGRNTYRFFNRLVHDRSVRRLALEGRLRNALQRQEFWLAYQPLVDTQSHVLKGAEVLLRWNSPEGGPVPPDQFIAVAEHTGLIGPIGEWVMDQACAQLAAWRKLGWTSLYVAVNVSPWQFRDSRIFDTVQAALQTHDVPAECLQIEVTEGLLIRNPPEVRATLQALSDLGVRLAMDDFGTGYSSLSYLKRFPFDVLKIDQEFVHGLATDSDDRALVAAAVSMGRGLGLTVVAEGVETAGQLSYLAEQRCDLVQGFLFSPPLPAQDFAARWLQARTVPQTLGT